MDKSIEVKPTSQQLDIKKHQGLDNQSFFYATEGPNRPMDKFSDFIMKRMMRME